MKRILIILFPLMFVHCNPEEVPKECRESECNRKGYSIVDADTDMNLVGYDRLYNPDDVKFVTPTGEELVFSKIYLDWADWWEFAFNYHDVVKNCNLYNTDSTFIITVYMDLNDTDRDTIDIRIAPCRDYDAIFFNGSENVTPPKETFNGINPSDLSPFFLRKKTN